jgi:hypothetical protein
MCDKCERVYQCIINNHRDCFNHILETQDNQTLIENNYGESSYDDDEDEEDEEARTGLSNEEQKIDHLLRRWCDISIDLKHKDPWYLERIEEEFGYFYTSGLTQSCFRGNFELTKYYIAKILKDPEDHYLLNRVGVYRCAVHAQSIEIVEYLRTLPQVPINKSIIESAVRNGHQDMIEYLIDHHFPYSSNLPKLAARHKQIQTFWYLVDELGLPFKNDQTMKLLDPCINEHNLRFHPLRQWLIKQYRDLIEREQTHLCPNIESLLAERTSLETLVKETLTGSLYKVADDILEYIIFLYL